MTASIATSIVLSHLIALIDTSKLGHLFLLWVSEVLYNVLQSQSSRVSESSSIF